MSDNENETGNGGPVNQSAVDDIFGDAPAPKDPMNLREIEGSLNNDTNQPEYVVGQPMAEDVTAIYDIPVQISAVLGRSTMQVSQLLKLGRGAVVELDRKVGEAIDIYVNNRLVARGEVVVVEDKLGVTMTEIVKSDRG
jgi:flagellar motor switch protein FliN/FliY